MSKGSKAEGHKKLYAKIKKLEKKLITQPKSEKLSDDRYLKRIAKYRKRILEEYNDPGLKKDSKIKLETPPSYESKLIQHLEEISSLKSHVLDLEKQCNTHLLKLRSIDSSNSELKQEVLSLKNELKEKADANNMLNEEVRRLQISEQELKRKALHESTMKNDHIAKLEIRLQRSKETISFKLGYLLIHSLKDRRKFFELPSNLFKLRKYAKQRMELVKLKELARPVSPIEIPSTKPPPPALSIQNSAGSLKAKSSTPKMKHGISIVIPSYRGEKTILKCLNSLFSQSLDHSLFEVIIVENGVKTSIQDIVSSFERQNSNFNIRYFFEKTPNASHARNVGISKARFSYTTFIDDDDWISKNYLSSMLKQSSSDRIVSTQIVDVYEDGAIDYNNPMNSQIKRAIKDGVYNLHSLSMVLTINACKLIPTEHLKAISFDSKLNSGEDVVFFSELIARKNFNLAVVQEGEKSYYFRAIRNNSVSRKPLSFDFNVVQRLDVISRLSKIIDCTDVSLESKNFVQSKINAQSGFLKRYIEKYPSESSKVRNYLAEQSIGNFPSHLLNKGEAKRLVIAYCFPPYIDTSGNVMAKRIIDSGRVVDVISNKLDGVRPVDPDLVSLGSEYIESRIVLDTPTSFSNWKAIEKFVISVEENTRKQYEEVYSRVLWPASHIAATALKLKDPSLRWIAEFSDPILKDIHAKDRYSEVDEASPIVRESLRIVEAAGHRVPAQLKSNLFFLCELLPYFFANELIFTNRNQLDYMLDYFPIDSMREGIKKKATISAHPSLPKHYYSKVTHSYSVDNSFINIGYFGTFYETRTLNEVLVGLRILKPEVRKRVRIHIFTEDTKLLSDQIDGIEENIIFNKFLRYFEFLNVCTKFDCLLVQDASTKHVKKLNPYLPSKVSDYSGSGAKVWALVEGNSILSEADSIHFSSELGDFVGASKVLEQLVEQ